MDERSKNLNYDRGYFFFHTRAGRMSVGMMLVLIGCIFCIFAFGDVRRQAYLKSHSSVTATITSKTEIRGGGGRGGGDFTRAIIDYWRETPRGPVRCTVPKSLPGWSSNYDIGKTLSIFPREETCYEPYTALGRETSLTMLILFPVSLIFVGALMIRYAGKDAVR
jgi:hypothetical protein